MKVSQSRSKISCTLTNSSFLCDPSSAPLFQAIKRNAPLAELKQILNQHPNAIHTIDKYGRTVLFLSIMNNQPFETIEYLLKLNTNQVCKPNINGDIPLHIVTCTKVAQLLLHYYPNGIYATTKHSKWLPLHSITSFEMSHLILQHHYHLHCGDQNQKKYMQQQEQGHECQLQKKYRQEHCVVHRHHYCPDILFCKDEAGFIPLEQLATSLEFCLRCNSITSIGRGKMTTLNYITNTLWDKLRFLTREMLNYYNSCSLNDAEKRLGLKINLRDRLNTSFYSDHYANGKICDQHELDSFKMVHGWIELRYMILLAAIDGCELESADVIQRDGTDNRANFSGSGGKWSFFGPLFETALNLYPHEIVEGDDMQRTPLVIAVQLAAASLFFDNNGNRNCSCWFSNSRQNDDTDTRCNANQHNISSEYENGGLSSYDVVDTLLKRSKISVTMTDGNGRLPIHFASESPFYKLCGKGGLIDIVMAAPQALGVRDPITGFYPFALAAAVSGDVHKRCCCTLDKIYYLLRESPQVLLRV